jgi:hypothetical protein
MPDTTGKSIRIFLFHLKRTDRALPDEWAQCIVAGRDEADARTTANEDARSESYVWKDESKALCRNIGIAEDGVQGIILWAPEVKVPVNEKSADGDIIFLLEKTDSADADQWAKVVVAASDEKQARLVTNMDSKADGYVWTDGYLASARKIGMAYSGVHGILLWAPEV